MAPVASLLLVFCAVCDLVISWRYWNVSLPFPSHSQQVALNYPNLYLFGGSSNSLGTLKLNISNLATASNWTILNDNPPPSITSNVQNSVMIKDLVYFLGTTYNETFVFNTSSDQWIQQSMDIATMQHPVIDGCISTNDTHIFSVGGIPKLNASDLTADASSSFLQVYDVAKNVWSAEKIPFLNHSTWSNQMCSMTDKKVLYVFGGLLNNQEIANVVYKYDTKTARWSFVANMTNALHNGWSVYYGRNQTIYIVGGTDNDDDLSVGIQHAVNIFNTTSDSFMGYNNMLDNVENAASVIVLSQLHKGNGSAADRMLVFGGCAPSDGDKACKAVSSVQISSLPLVVYSASDDSVKNIWWILIAAIAGFVVCIGLICWCELRVGSNNEKVINQDPLITNNDMNTYDE